MARTITNFTIFLFLLVSIFSCKGKKSKQDKSQEKYQATLIIPFLPGSCHQCNNGFYRNLKLLESKKIEYAILLSEDFSDDLENIKKEFNLVDYKVNKYIFSSSLYEKYHIYEQNYVLQYGVDSSCKIYNDADLLIKDLDILNKQAVIDLGDYKIKKSTENLTVSGKDQICVHNRVQTNRFDYLDLKNKKKPLSITFTEDQLLNNFILNFKDSAIAKSKLNEISKITDIPFKDKFDQAIFYHDSLFILANHTYIESLKDSVLGGFMIINIYKDGKYLGARPISNEHIPMGFYAI